MLPSLHQRQLVNGDETVRDFARAWALVEPRRRGKQVPRGCLDARLLDYEEIGSLGKHVGRFFDVIGRERCFVSVFDDLVANPAAQYGRVLEFLELPPDSRTDFSPQRVSAGVRIQWLQSLLKRPPKAVFSLIANPKDLLRAGKTGRLELMGFGGHLFAAAERVLEWNRTDPPAVKLSEEMEAELREWMRDDILRLAELIGRDLSHWIAPPERRIEQPSLVPDAGFEPATFGLQNRCSTN
jgi:hypothetical protein